MGAPMAINLARAGFPVAAWNRSPEKLAPLREHGVVAAASPADAAISADVLIVMLSTGAVCDAVLFEAGAEEALPADATVVVMSSIPVAVARAQAARLAARGIGYVDAPVSGGERGAIAGTLSIMAGGEAAVLARLAPVLAPLGRVTHVGPVGAGQLAKLANQAIVGITIGAVAEALLLAEAGGADPNAVLAALQGGFADSTILRQHGARMVARDFVPGARAHVQLKDMRTILAQGEATGVDMPFARLAGTLFERLCAETPELDHSALYLLLRAASAALGGTA